MKKVSESDNKKIVIIHFSPLELYPPVMNLLNYLSNFHNELKVTVISTKPAKGLIKFSNNKIHVIRCAHIIPSKSKIHKIWRYLNFYTSSFMYFLKFKPGILLYFETLSALSCIWYHCLFRKPPIFVHYHELVTLEELRDDRLLNQYINNIEKKHYATFKWISHTNSTRLNMFAHQYNLDKNSPSLKIMPNYPPQTWLKHIITSVETHAPIKLVHIGALSLKGMYLEKVLNHFGSYSKYSIDFYFHKFTKEIETAIHKHQNCNIKGAIDYHKIPELKGKYDVGLVLYNGSSVNFIYNTPNKIFEYLALDLDVWCSDKLITAKEMERVDCYPKVIMVDYNNLSEFDVDAALK